MKPGEGERLAVSGYRYQYLVGADETLDALEEGYLEWVRVADPEAGSVDDFQIARTARVDAYQVKWKQYGGVCTLKSLVDGTNGKPSLIAQLADGWQQLQKLHPSRRVIIHFVTNAHPSFSRNAWIPEVDSPPTPYNLAAFFEQSWNPTRSSGILVSSREWAGVWEELRTASGLSTDEFLKFVSDCSLDFNKKLPEDNKDMLALANLLIETVASSERVIELSREELLQKLGWMGRYTYRNIHKFPDPPFSYRPILSTKKAVEAALKNLCGGYVGVFGPPGSGKSTLLTQTLQTLQALPPRLRLVRYYAYVPESLDPTVLRGESDNFLHDVTLQLQEMRFGIGKRRRPDISDRISMINQLHDQLSELGDDYKETGIRTVILIDGLDHIERDQDPERSLLKDLPLPQSVPNGVYFVIGSQTDELRDLPPLVDHAFKQQEGRRIEMGRLSRSDVYAFVEVALPILNSDERKQVFEDSGGHPLALIYLVKKLLQSSDQEERAQVLQETIPYEGDIETQYWGHWRAVEDDAVEIDNEVVHPLGLLARVRGPIPMRWVAGWLDEVPLRKLKRLSVPYFEEDSENHWVFFHNSFQNFLVKRTGEPLPGQTPKHQGQVYHRKLAELYEVSSESSWQWDSLYHRFMAEDYSDVVRMATTEWFREQVEGLRPLYAVQIDARLALRAAGFCRDVVALIRLTLVGASLEQRAWVLEDRSLPDLLLEAGEVLKAAKHLRDGKRLHVEAEQALRLSTRLSEAGLKKEGHLVFELAEPLELLSGRPIPDDHTRPHNLWELLRAWVKSAIYYRDPIKVITVVRRIQIAPEFRRTQNEPTHRQKEEAERASYRLQNMLLFHGALACARWKNWSKWKTLYDALDKGKDRVYRLLVLIQTAEWADKAGDGNHFRMELNQLLQTYQPGELGDVDENRWRIMARLAVAEFAFYINNDEATARAWTVDLLPIPLQDQTRDSQGEPTLHELRFRLGRLRYLLGETREPDAMLSEAEANTNFAKSSRNEEQKPGHRQMALAVFNIAKFWVWGHLGQSLTPAAFLREMNWVLDLLGPGWTSWPVSFRRAAAEDRAEVLSYLVSAAVKHGDDVVTSLADELESRWSDPNEAPKWHFDLQRKLIISLEEVGVDQAWAESQLRRITPFFLQNLDPYSRAEACEAQVVAWLKLGKREAAFEEIRRMVHGARGILSDRDYQLTRWVNWLDHLNDLEPEQASERLGLMLRRIISLQRSATGVGDAAEALLEVVIRWSPRSAVVLFKSLLERQIIGHQGGMTRLLMGALDAQEPPISEILHTVVDLILPLVSGSEPDLLETIIVRTSERCGFDAALETARYMIRRIEIGALANHRPMWYRGVADGLRTIGSSLSQVGLQPSKLRGREKHSDSHLDGGLYLISGEKLEPDEVQTRVRTIGDLRELIEEEDRKRTRYFKWAVVAEHLAPKLSSEIELRELDRVIESRLDSRGFSEIDRSQTLTALSKRFLALGDRTLAWEFAKRAVDLKKASVWDPYFDGGVRHAALRQLVAVDPDPARKFIIPLFAQDISERFCAPDKIVPHLYDIFMLLSGEVTLAEVWGDIEIYLDELFASTPVEQQPELEELLREPGHALEENTPARAIADLLTIHLDHPSYTVAQGAVRACTTALLSGSSAVTAALGEVLTGNDLAVERALFVLDAASMEDPYIVGSFEGILERLCLSSNFTVRLIASIVYARIVNVSPLPQIMDREIPAIYTLHLPKLSLHRTELAMKGMSDLHMISDPALTIRPFDIVVSALAKDAGLPEDNVLDRAEKHFRALERQRTWLGDIEALDDNRLAGFLRQVGLIHATYKPHITSARYALAYVVAELCDGGYFPPNSLQLLSKWLLRHDPVFILKRPDERPSSVNHIDGIPVNERSYTRLPDRWVEMADESLSLLHQPRAGRLSGRAGR